MIRKEAQDILLNLKNKVSPSFNRTGLLKKTLYILYIGFRKNAHSA